jgi:hypothetical protein
MNAQLIKKEVESICNRKIAKLRNASRLIYNGRAISKLNQQIEPADSQPAGSSLQLVRVFFSQSMPTENQGRTSGTA